MYGKQRMAALLIFVLVLMAVFGGCVSKSKAQGVKAAGQENLQDYTVHLYYANTAYIQTGDEKLARLQEPLEVKIRSLPADVYADTIEYLKHPPADEKYSTGLPEGIELNSVVVEDGTAVVDFSSKNLNGGSLQEMFTIAQIVNSLVMSFEEEIKQVQFTVDGEVAETLMGHMMITDPISFQQL